MTSFPKTWSAAEAEQKWYQHWEAAGYFAPQGQGKPYCIMLPPPNVTGSLHMGHGFGFTLIDILIRYHRMRGDRTLWQPGTDHAGIATQLMVERDLARNNQTRTELGREKFVEKIWAWKNASGSRITQQLRRLGASPDWSRECFTLDTGLSQAVREVFIRLHEEGLIYRGTRLVNWDPTFLTAISDLEVISQEEDTHLWHIRYPLAEGKGHVVVATTRPETLLGDMAVAVHPEDARYVALIGKSLRLPLTDRLIPVIADEYVEPTFGSGCVKITPAHDFNDYAIGQRHGLTPKNIFTPDARLNDSVPAAYQGLERFAARKKIISDLQEQGLLEKTEKYRTKIPRGEKSNIIIEPRLTEQWFLKMKPLATPAMEAVRAGKIRFHPDNWHKTWFQWMENIEDWCISRQLWWGHRIPIWYDAEGNAYAAHDEADVRTRHRLSADIALHQDDDVLDTWFSSALWPFSSLGWPEKNPVLTACYPGQVLVTGFDIIFFWVARMIMLGLKFMGDVPFREVYITGLIRDAEGQKMSKTKGNVLDPIDLIDGISLTGLLEKRLQGVLQSEKAKKIEQNTQKEFPEGIEASGTDALRFTFCMLASQNREIRFDTGRLGGYRNFCNKLWNAARLVLMLAEGQSVREGDKTLADHWILSELQKTIQAADQHLADYRFDLLASILYEFVWNTFCDWYLELSKSSTLPGTHHVRITVLETVLRLLHPVMPFITEEIWQHVAPLLSHSAGESIMLQPWPTVQPALTDSVTARQAEKRIAWLKTVVTAIRTLRSEMQIAPGKQIPLLLQHGTAEDQAGMESEGMLVQALARLSDIRWLSATETPPEAMMTVAGSLEIRIPTAGLIDWAEERERLSREIQKTRTERLYTENKLQNPDFVARAPAHVVEKEKAKQAELTDREQRLEQQLKNISSTGE